MKQPGPDVVVAGKYLLEGQLAAGGMGSVWVAKHKDLGVPVAIKFMDPECASTEEGRSRFEREAKAAALLQCPNVVTVQDYGVDDGLAYIVMELLVGEDLEDRLFRVNRLDLHETLSVLTQAARALRRAQDLGIVHRDIKPQNIYLSASGDDGEELVKILDFGIAKETGPVLLAKQSNTGQIIGSPHYMSPEQVRGAKDLDHRADLWSMGVIVFQCVTGRLPFPGENVGDVMGMILADPLPKATAIAPDLPPELDAFFDKALARDRTQRFQSAREMVEAFVDIVGPPSSGHPRYIPLSARPPAVAPNLAFAPASASTPPPSLAAVAGRPTDKAASGDSVSLPARVTSRKGPLMLTAGLLALGGALLFLGLGGGKGGGDTAQPAAEAQASTAVTPPATDSAPPAAPPSTAAASASAQPSTGAGATPGGPAPEASASTSARSSGKSSGTAAPKGSAKAGKSKQDWGF